MMMMRLLVVMLLLVVVAAAPNHFFGACCNCYLHSGKDAQRIQARTALWPGRHDWEAVVCTCCFIGCYFSSWNYHEFTCDVVQCILTQKCNSKERLPQVPTKKCRTDSLEFGRAWGFSDVLSLNAQTIHVRDFCWNTTLSENANTYPKPRITCVWRKSLKISHLEPPWLTTFPFPNQPKPPKVLVSHGSTCLGQGFDSEPFDHGPWPQPGAGIFHIRLDGKKIRPILWETNIALGNPHFQ